MSNLVPIVTPANDTSGIALEFLPTAIFEKSIDEGSISSGSCFITEISKQDADTIDDYITNASIQDVLPAIVTSERINLLDEDPFLGLDFGGDVDSGEKYRTKISIDPDIPLKPNTTYAAILSKDLSLLSVFDPEPNGANTGTGELISQGVYTELISDTYTITVITAGDKNSAMYVWSRSSDGHTSVSLEARNRLIEIDRGLKVKFEDGTYSLGDTFVIEVLPADKQIDIFSWTFSSGAGDYQTPDDQNSGSLLNLPVSGGSGVSADGFFVTKVEPADGASLVRIPRKANIKVGDIIISTVLYTSSFNNYTIEFLDGATAGAEVVALVSEDISITIEAGVSTAQQVVDAFNASVLVNVDFLATTELATALQEVQVKSKLSKGVDNKPITITFNKDINASTVSDKVLITTRPVYPTGPTEDLSFSTNVSGNQLVITLDERQ